MNQVSTIALTGASLVTAQVAGSERAPSSPSTTRAVAAVAASAVGQPSDTGRAGPNESRTFGPLRPAEGDEAEAQDSPDRKVDGRTFESRTVADLWRARFDAETLRMFTEVVDPVTREAKYRVPPNTISEEAEREGRDLARRERLRMGPEYALVI